MAYRVLVVLSVLLVTPDPEVLTGTRVYLVLLVPLVQRETRAEVTEESQERRETWVRRGRRAWHFQGRSQEPPLSQSTKESRESQGIEGIREILVFLVLRDRLAILESMERRGSRDCQGGGALLV